MSLSEYLRGWLQDPVQLSIKQKCLSALACFCAILLTGWITRLTLDGQSPVLVASMGASAVILFAIPNSPLAQPWPFLGGQLLSAAIGVGASYYISDTVWALFPP